MIGQCLCGTVQFSLTSSLPNFYQCHCRLCQKVTGSSANAGTLVEKAQFKWLSGTDNITSYTRSTGYRVDFCKTCSSPVPNPLRSTELVWIPVGLLDNPEGNVVIHLHSDSKAGWDELPAEAPLHKTMPSLDKLHRLLGAEH